MRRCVGGSTPIGDGRRLEDGHGPARLMDKESFAASCLMEGPRKLPAERPVTPAAGVLNLTAWKTISMIIRSYGRAPSLTMDPKDGPFEGHGPAGLVVHDELRGILPGGVAAKATCGVARHTSGWYPEPYGLEGGFVDHPVVQERTLNGHRSQEWADRRLLGVELWLRNGHRSVAKGGERKWFGVPFSGAKS